MLKSEKFQKLLNILRNFFNSINWYSVIFVLKCLMISDMLRAKFEDENLMELLSDDGASDRVCMFT